MKKSISCDKPDIFHSAWFLGAFAALLFTVTGCVSGGGAETVPRLADGPAMKLASGLYERGRSLGTLAARGGVSYTDGRARRYFKFELVAMKPNKVLFTALDPAGRPAFRLAADGRWLTGIAYGAAQYFSGPATAENFSRVLPLGLSPEELTGLLTGAQVRPAAAGVAKSGGGSTELVIEPAGGKDDGGRLWRVKVAGEPDQEPASAVVETAAFGPARRPELVIRYGAVKNVPREDRGGRPEPFPHSLAIQWSDSGRKNLQVTYDEIRLGLPVGEDIFTLAGPDGFESLTFN